MALNICKLGGSMRNVLYEQQILMRRMKFSEMLEPIYTEKNHYLNHSLNSQYNGGIDREAAMLLKMK